MTGYYVRILRDGSWQNIEVDQLTDDELDDFARMRPEAGWKWAKALARWIRDNVRAMDIEDVADFD